MKQKVAKVLSSSIEPNTCTIAISASLKKSRNECRKMREASKVHQSRVEILTWNGGSIAITTLDFIVIVNTLDCKSKALVDRMDGHILTASRGVFAFKLLISSKCRSKQ